MLGLIGKKIGMTQVFDELGVLTPVTVIKIDENVVVGEKTEEQNGYTSVVLGSVDETKRRRLTKPVVGQFPEGIAPKRFVKEMRDFDLDVEVGKSLDVNVFAEVGFVDVIGTSKGKGFQGAMKRHNFKGGRATHGSKFHRGLGGTGAAANPSRVFKGTKMPGHMGDEQKTVQNLKVVRVDAEKGIMLVKGAVPGPRQGLVIVRKAKKR